MAQDNLKLFDELERYDLKPARYSEPRWEFLNRSARPFAGYIRELLQLWFDDFEASTDKRLRLQKEFCADDEKHLAAFLELYVYHLFKKQGFEIEVEPEWKKGCPDFLLTSHKGKKILLDATGVYPPRWFGTEEKQRRIAIDYLNEHLVSPDFTLEMEVVTSSRSQLSCSNVFHQVRTWLASLDYNQVVNDLSQSADAEFEKYPVRIAEYGDWAIKFTALPLPESQRAAADLPPIGIQFDGAERPDIVSSIKTRIDDKNSQFGELDIPYLLALNIVDDFVSVPKIAEYSIATALFGEEAIAVNRETREHIFYRRRNGVLFMADKYKMTRTSGICVFNELTPISMLVRDAVLWHHPSPQHPLEPDLFSITQNILNSSEGHYELREGTHPRELLSIDATKWTL